MRFDIMVLARAIQQAAIAAAQHRNADDGGTCNFDTAFIKVPQMQLKTANELQTLSGVSLTLSKTRIHGRILKLNVSEGQANRNTQMAEAAYRSLKASGIAAGMYYQMD